MNASEQRDEYLGKKIGNIHLLERIGAGGMGLVYRGTNLVSKQEVAIKLLQKQVSERDDQYNERFLREIRVAAKIHHKNVVQVLDAGVQDGLTYLVMELVRGGSLGDILDTYGKIAVDKTIKYSSQIAEGLAAIHKAGIVHRDIKPDNILIDEDDNIKITDLGLARQVDDPAFKRLTASGMVIGTPYYLAPEAIRNASGAGPEADIYSLGATLYHLLSGEAPFDAISAYEIMRAHLEDRHRPIRELNKEVPRGIANLIDRCLAKEPSERPQANNIHLALQSGGMRSNSTSGLVVVAFILIGAIASGAVLGWQAFAQLEKGHALMQIDSETAAHVRVHASLSNLRYRHPGAPWQRLRKDGITLSPGRHDLEFEGIADGAFLVARESLELAERERKEIYPQLGPLFCTDKAILETECKKGEHFFLQGQDRGYRRSYEFEQAGRYVIACWNGSESRERNVNVSTDGKITLGEWKMGNFPSSNVLVRSTFQYKDCLPHHVLSWWACEQVRIQNKLESSLNWREQSLDPQLPALSPDLAIIHAVERHYRLARMEIPNRDQARQLSELYGRAVWYSTNGRLRPYGRGSRNDALLILVPSA